MKAAIEAGVVSLFIQAMRAGGYGSPEFTNEVQHFRLEVLPWGGVTNSFHWKINARLPAFGSMALDPANRGGNAGVRVTVWLFENLELSTSALSYPSHFVGSRRAKLALEWREAPGGVGACVRANTLLAAATPPDTSFVALTMCHPKSELRSSRPH